MGMSGDGVVEESRRTLLSSGVVMSGHCTAHCVHGCSTLHLHSARCNLQLLRRHLDLLHHFAASLLAVLLFTAFALGQANIPGEQHKLITTSLPARTLLVAGILDLAPVFPLALATSSLLHTLCVSCLWLSATLLVLSAASSHLFSFA